MRPLITNIAIILVLTPLALATLYAMLRAMDWVSVRTGWKVVCDNINTEPLSAAIYYGLRFLGAAILCAYLFSRYI